MIGNVYTDTTTKRTELNYENAQNKILNKKQRDKENAPLNYMYR